MMDSIAFQGRTDPSILHDSLLTAGINPAYLEKKMAELQLRFFSHLSEILPDYKPALLPGVRDILEYLHVRDDILTGLLTGNFHKSARIKLDYHDLNPFFDTGAFGDDAPMREQLPPVALERIRNYYGVIVPMEDVIIVGDTVHDVRCARVNGGRSLAVGTGFGNVQEVIDEGPDWFVENLDDPKVRCIFSGEEAPCE
jgi:phosphoglycolate phosphatase-like HAD superfamily hydrolase